MDLLRSRAALLALLLLLSCTPRPAPPAGPQPEGPQSAGPHAAAEPIPATDPRRGPLRLELNLSERQLHVFLGNELHRTYPVAVGQPEYPTPTGEFAIHQVDWNPDWTPPRSRWARGRSYQPPGAPGNPMGRARLIYQRPYSIHGTEDLESLGGAESHGSIRMANPHVIELGRLVMAHGGARWSEEWLTRALENPRRMRSVRLPNPVPLVNRR